VSSTVELHRGNRTLVVRYLDGEDSHVHKSLLSFADVERERRALYREAELQHRARGPGVVPIVSPHRPPFAAPAQIAHICRPYIEGQTLRELASENKLDTTNALSITCALLRILDHVHRLSDANGTSLGMVHRDVTPGNVLVDRSGRVWLNDFGLARIHTDPPLEQDETLQGTRSFLAPELLRGEQCSQASDVHQAAHLLSLLLGHPELDPQSLAPWAAQDALAPDPEARPTAKELETLLLP